MRGPNEETKKNETKERSKKNGVRRVVVRVRGGKGRGRLSPSLFVLWRDIKWQREETSRRQRQPTTKGKRVGMGWMGGRGRGWKGRDRETIDHVGKPFNPPREDAHTLTCTEKRERESTQCSHAHAARVVHVCVCVCVQRTTRGRESINGSTQGSSFMSTGTLDRCEVCTDTT